MLLYRDYDLRSFNTLALPARAKKVVEFDDVNQLPALQALVRIQPNKRRWVLGGGSNMVMADCIDALIIKAKNTGVRLIKQRAGEVIVEAQAGEVWHHFVQHCLNKGWYGLENLALIPGTVGAAPVQNIGAYGVELEQRVYKVQAWDFERGELRDFHTDECEFSYRDSYFKRSAAGRYLITAVWFVLNTAQKWQPVLSYADLRNHPDLQEGSAITAQGVFNAVVQVREQKLPDPKLLPNAGSFFKNPVVTKVHYEQLKSDYPELVGYEHGPKHYKLAAGWLIDKAGWKGKLVGPVGMHKNQALVLVNYGGARAADVTALVEQIKSHIKQLFDVALEQEPIAIN